MAGPHFHRRGFLQCVVVTAFVAGCGAAEESLSRRGSALSGGSGYFPQSIASGDPRPSSVILWTRVVDAARPGEDLTLSLEVATDEDFASIVASRADLPAQAAHDGTLKVKLTGLDPHTYYFYRFYYAKNGEVFASNIGRTRTAPNANASTKVSLAIASCQSMKSRYYHAWQRLLDADPRLDAVVYLGDYVYETTGGSGDRVTSFTAPSEAIVVRAATSTSPARLAANSLGNYRDLYKQYRSDPVLQQVHERWPFIATWDDHEFSDDGFGATSTYTDGKFPETTVDRKQRAERVFFEYMPIDVVDSPDGAINPDDAAVYPNTKIWRDFEFGRNVKIVMADYRTNRPDCYVPLNGFPGKVIADQAYCTANSLFAFLSSSAFAYVNIDDPAYAIQKSVLISVVRSLEQAAGFTGTERNARAAAKVTGNLCLLYVNGLLAAAGQSALAISSKGQPRGLAYVHFGKQDLYGQVGSHYFVNKDIFDIWSAHLYAKTGGASENVFGNEQDAWVKSRIESDTKWKVIGSSVSMTEMFIDLNKPDVLDPNLKARFYTNVDSWDGFRNKKRELTNAARGSAETTIFVCGDVHASFVSEENGAVCVTAPAIASSPFQAELDEELRAAKYSPESTDPSKRAVYQHVVGETDQSFREANPGILWSNNADNGVVVIDFDNHDAEVTYYLSSGANTLLPYGDAAIAGGYSEKKFVIKDNKVRAR